MGAPRRVDLMCVSALCTCACVFVLACERFSVVWINSRANLTLLKPQPYSKTCHTVTHHTSDPVRDRAEPSSVSMSHTHTSLHPTAVVAHVVAYVLSGTFCFHLCRRLFSARPQFIIKTYPSLDDTATMTTNRFKQYKLDSDVRPPASSQHTIAVIQHPTSLQDTGGPLGSRGANLYHFLG